MPGLPHIWLVTGVPGAGKSTTAAALAARSPRGVHISGDDLQRLIVSGSEPPSPEGGPESDRQIELNVRNQCLLAGSFRAAGFTVVLDYVITSTDRLDAYLEGLPAEPIGLVVLAPPLATAARRDLHRSEKQVLGVWMHLEAEIGAALGDRGLWLDTEGMDVDQVVDAIVAGSGHAVLPPYA